MVSAFAQAQNVTVGAKHFTEGYILSEIMAQLLEANGFTVDRKYNLGGTMVCYKALERGEIDVYPEYTGTLSFEILAAAKNLSVNDINAQLKTQKLAIAQPYGFSNTYALVVPDKWSREKGVRNISDLQSHPEAKIGLSYEFLKRQDGWENLAKAYTLLQTPVGLEHGLAYSALVENKIEVTDAYSTDGEIVKHHLVVLNDDQKFFPDYLATSFFREDLDPKAQKVLEALTETITPSEMQAMNAAVLFEKKNFQQVAAGFLKDKKLVNDAAAENTSIVPDLLVKTGVHLRLTFISLLLAMLVAIPLGIVLYWNPVPARYVLYAVGLLQTIPSIALLAIFIPLTGIGEVPAVAALFLYALLPMVRNTYTGLQGIDPVLKKVAVGMGMNKTQRMKMLELPLAMPFILSGIRTAAVISVGTATLAAFIGAGGLGEYIVTGLALNNTSLILRGAIPAAVLAIAIEMLFEVIEQIAKPKYLK
nr:glycine betaine ABC transporter substrate-binding protein [Chryseolinea lacunae]